MINWMQTEAFFGFDEYKLSANSWTLKKRTLICTSVYLTISAVEHVLFHSSELYSLLYKLDYCNKTKNDIFQIYISSHFDFIYKNLPFAYNLFNGIILEYLAISCTFIWNFLDLFIILTSIGVSFLYEKLNSRVQNLRGLKMSEKIWAEIRNHYVKIQELMTFINQLMGEMIMFACFVDGYFILVQLLNITK